MAVSVILASPGNLGGFPGRKTPKFLEQPRKKEPASVFLGFLGDLGGFYWRVTPQFVDRSVSTIGNDQRPEAGC